MENRVGPGQRHRRARGRSFVDVCHRRPGEDLKAEDWFQCRHEGQSILPMELGREIGSNPVTRASGGGARGFVPLSTTNRIEAQCRAKGMRLTDQRRLITQVLSNAEDHPDVFELHRRVVAQCPHVSLATVYRTVRRLEAEGIVERHEFRDGHARYERASKKHHDHLIDLETGNVIEFRNAEIGNCKRRSRGGSVIGWSAIGWNSTPYQSDRPLPGQKPVPVARLPGQKRDLQIE